MGLCGWLSGPPQSNPNHRAGKIQHRLGAEASRGSREVRPGRRQVRSAAPRPGSDQACLCVRQLNILGHVAIDLANQIHAACEVGTRRWLGYGFVLTHALSTLAHPRLCGDQQDGCQQVRAYRPRRRGCDSPVYLSQAALPIVMRRGASPTCRQGASVVNCNGQRQRPKLC
jgi:hypothetical protein